MLQPADRPIIFVAHSLGGLVCANALSHQQGPNDTNVSLVNNTTGIIFLGTPFEGSSKARWGNRALQLLQLVSSTNDKMKVLEERSQKLVDINANFYKLVKKRDQSASHLKVACFFEVYPMYVARKDIGLIVPKDSATLSGIDPIPIEASHTGMCRFVDEHRNGYKNISNTLTEWIRRLGEKPSSADDGQVSFCLHSVRQKCFLCLKCTDLYL
jgi:pimeloyl-ACP methyl ester carboxylesterase